MFRFFSIKNSLNESNISTFVLTSVVLHNMLRKKSVNTYIPSGFGDKIDNNGYMREST